MPKRYLSIVLALAVAPALLLAELNVQEFTLPSNGMKVLIVQRHEAPVVSTRIWFNVGSVDEPTGSTGMAHLLEHMLFKGTRTLGVTDYAKEKVYLAQEDSVWGLIDTENAKANPDQAVVDTLKSHYEQILAHHKKLIIKNELWDTYLNNGGSGLNASTSEDWTQYQVQLPSNRMELWAAIESDRMHTRYFGNIIPSGM